MVMPSNNNKPNPVAAPAPPLPPAIISVKDYHLNNGTFFLYDVKFDSHTIETLVTSDPSAVDCWLLQIPRHYPNYPSLFVGLDITEWRPNSQYGVRNHVATLQLCIGHHCLIYQILHSHSIPISLTTFLSDRNQVFFGVDVHEDTKKLHQDYFLNVPRCLDLRRLAADLMGDPSLRNASLTKLCQRVMWRDFIENPWIAGSKWDDRFLSPEQVQYAVVDAYLSYEIGYRLFFDLVPRI